MPARKPRFRNYGLPFFQCINPSCRRTIDLEQDRGAEKIPGKGWVCSFECWDEVICGPYYLSHY